MSHSKLAKFSHRHSLVRTAVVSGAVMSVITEKLQRIWRAAASKQEEERAEVEILSEETRRRLKLRLWKCCTVTTRYHLCINSHQLLLFKYRHRTAVARVSY